MRTRFIGLLPALVVALAEGAWVAVVYAALDVVLLDGHAGLGLWPFPIAAGLGIVLARAAGNVDGRLGVVGLALVLPVAFVVGALLNVVLGGLPVTRPTDLLNAAALMTMIAVWRGAGHWRPEHDDLNLSTLLGIGVPALALPFVIAVAVTGTQRQEFLALALPATLLFVTAGLAGVGLTRLAALGRATGIDWRTNRSWLVLLGSLIAGLLIIGLPVAVLLGAPLTAVFGWAIDPLRAAIDTSAAVVRGLASAAGYPVPPTTPTATSPGEPYTLPLGSPAPFAILLPLTFLALFVLVVLFAVRRRRATRRVRPLGIEFEESGLELPHIALPGLRLPTLRLRRARRPRTASEAYVAALEQLHGSVARSTAESPRGHARRVEGRLGWRFSLLAADYELERYAGAELTGAETGRALRRAAEQRKR